MPKSHGPSVKDDRRYEELRKQGMSKEKAGEVGIRGRSTMDKKELIGALRNH